MGDPVLVHDGSPQGPCSPPCPSRGARRADACILSGQATPYTRCTHDPERTAGVPWIRGLRIPVDTVIGLVAEGLAVAEILAACPDLETEDVAEAPRFAADAVRERELPLTHAT